MSLSLLVVLVALPMFAAAVLGLRYLVGREQRMLLARARQLECTGCGALLGDQGVALADALWERHVQHVFEQKQAVKQRIVRNLDAACPKCGARYQYDHVRATFAPVEVSLSFESRQSGTNSKLM